MKLTSLSRRDLEIIEFCLDDLLEAIDDGDREGFSPHECAELLRKVLKAKEDV